jgi:cytochrome c-type biogenesis protein CcmH
MIMKKKVELLIFITFIILALSFVPAISVPAQQPTPSPSDDEVNAIASQLFCPVCQNTPLDVCPTQACRQWRELIRQMLAEGKTAAEIKQYFVTYYGASVLSEPPRSGINWLIYIVPPVAFMTGVFLLFMAFRTWKKSATRPVTAPNPINSRGAETGSGPAADDPYISRLEDELKKRK